VWANEADDDELMDPMLLELQIQIRVGETAGTPMFQSRPRLFEAQTRYGTR